VQTTEVQAAFTDLLAKTRLSPKEVKDLARRAHTKRYWQLLNPKLNSSTIRYHQIINRAFQNSLDQISADGYFHLPSVFHPGLMNRMRIGIDRIRKAGWPPIFAMVYDEFWSLVRTPPVVRMLEGILGRGYRQIPHVWCHYVNPVEGARGWGPHVDGTSRNRVSIWIPLTSATLDNGCIYLIPGSRLPSNFARQFLRRRSYSKIETVTMLQAMKAMPASAGSMLGWHFGIVHWGAVAGDSPQPRVSVAYEFIAGGSPPQHDELPLMPSSLEAPSFEERLRVIGTAILSYRKFEPRLERFAALASRLL
jgi:hypothetical protein